MDQNTPPLNSSKNALENGNTRERVQVVVRLRPEKEGKETAIQRAVFCNGTNDIILVPPERKPLCELQANENRKRKATKRVFTFGGVMSEMTSQSTVYEKYVASLVESACRGWNATVFAYGCTSSGKSYTMQGVPGDEGIVPRALEDVFKHVNDALQHGESSDMAFSAHISFVELYNGRFRQLLEDEEDHTGCKSCCPCSKHENREAAKIEVRENKGRDAYLVGGPNLRRPVTNLQEAKMLVCAGNHRRETRATDCNAQSSRSHAILTVYIESSNNSEVRVGKIHLVDLAGSERASMSGAIGKQMMELKHNNLALSNLGLVLHHLASCQTDLLGQSKIRIPYRNNKLTHFLKDSIGGNSKTLMITTLRTVTEFYQQSLMSLLYSSRAMHIQNRTRLNLDTESVSHLAGVEAEMAELKHRLHERTPNLNQALTLHRDGLADNKELKKQLKQLSIVTDRERHSLERKLATMIFKLQHTGITHQRKELDSLSRILHNALEKSEAKSAEHHVEISQLQQSLQEVKEGMAASRSEIDDAQSLKQQVLQARQAQAVEDDSSQDLEMIINTFLEEQKIGIKAAQDKEKGIVSAWFRVSEAAGLTTTTTTQGPVPVNTLCSRVLDLVDKASLCDEYQKQTNVLRRSYIATSAALVAAQRFIGQCSTSTERNNPLLWGDFKSSLEFDKQQELHHPPCHIVHHLNPSSCEENDAFQPEFEKNDHSLAKKQSEDDVHTSERMEFEYSLSRTWKSLSDFEVLREGQQQVQQPLCSAVFQEKCRRHLDEIRDEAQEKSQLQVFLPGTTTLPDQTQNIFVPKCGTAAPSTEEVRLVAAPRATERDPVQEMKKEELRLLQYEYECRKAELKSALKESRALVEQIRVSYTRAEEIRRTEIVAKLHSERCEKQISLNRCNELRSSMKILNDLLVEAYNKISVLETSEREVCSQLSQKDSVIEDLRGELGKYETLYSNLQQELVDMRHEKKASSCRNSELQHLVFTLKSSLQESRTRALMFETLSKESQSMAVAELESSKNELKLKLDVAQSEWQTMLDIKEFVVSELQQELGHSRHDQRIALDKCNELSASAINLESSRLELRKRLTNFEAMRKEAQRMAEVELESSKVEFELKLKLAESEFKKVLSANESREAEFCNELRSARDGQRAALEQCDKLKDSVRILESSLHESQKRFMDLKTLSKEAQHMATAELQSSKNELNWALKTAQSEWQAMLDIKEFVVSELQQELGHSRHDQRIALDKCNELSASAISLESSCLELRKRLTNFEAMRKEAQRMAEVELESSKIEFELKLKTAESEFKKALSANESREAEFCNELRSARDEQRAALEQYDKLKDSVRILESSLHESQKRFMDLKTLSKEAQHMATAELQSSKNELNWELKTAQNELQVALKAGKILMAEVQQELATVHHEKNMALNHCNELHSLVMRLKVSLRKSRTRVSNIETIRVEEQRMAVADFESLRNELQWKLKKARSELDTVQNTTTKLCRAGLCIGRLEDDIYCCTAHRAEDANLSRLNARVSSTLQTDIGMALRSQTIDEKSEQCCSDLHTIAESNMKNSLAIERDDRIVHSLEASCKGTDESHVASVTKVCCCGAVREKYEEELHFHSQNQLNLTKQELEKERMNHHAVLKKTSNLKRTLRRAQKRILELEKMCAEAKVRAIECDPAPEQRKRYARADQLTKHEHFESSLLSADQCYAAASAIQQQPQDEYHSSLHPCRSSTLMYLVKDLHSVLNAAYDKAAATLKTPELSGNDAAYTQLGQQDLANEGRKLRFVHQHISEIQAAGSHTHHVKSELRLPGTVAVGMVSCKECRKREGERCDDIGAWCHCCWNKNNLNNLNDFEENHHDIETLLTRTRENALKLLKVVHDNNDAQASKFEASLEEAQNRWMQAESGRIQLENELATVMIDLERIMQEHATVLSRIDDLNVFVGTLKEKLSAAQNKSLELDALREEAQFIAAGTELTLIELKERLGVAQTSNDVILKENACLKAILSNSHCHLIKLQNIYEEEKYSKESKLELMNAASLEKQFCMYKKESASIQQRLIQERTEALDQCNLLSVSVGSLENLLSKALEEISELNNNNATSHKKDSSFVACQESLLQSKLEEGHGRTAKKNRYSTTMCSSSSSTLSSADPVSEADYTFVNDKEAKEAEVLQHQIQTQWHCEHVRKIKEKEEQQQIFCKDSSHVRAEEAKMRNNCVVPRSHSQVEKQQVVFLQGDRHFPSEGLRVLNIQQQQPNGVLIVKNKHDESLKKMEIVESSRLLDGNSSCNNQNIGREVSRRAAAAAAAATRSQVEGIEHHPRMMRTDIQLDSSLLFPGMADQHLTVASIDDATQLEAAEVAPQLLREICEHQLKMDVSHDIHGEKPEADDQNQTHRQPDAKLKMMAVKQSIKLPGPSPPNVVMTERKVLKETFRGNCRTSCGGGGIERNCQSVAPRRQPLQQKNDSNNRNILQPSVDLTAPVLGNGGSGCVNLKIEGVVKKKKLEQSFLNNINDYEAFLAEDNERNGGPNKLWNCQYKDREMSDLISKPPKDQQQPPLCGDRRTEAKKKSTISPPLVFKVSTKREYVVEPPDVRTVRCIANDLFAIGQQCIRSRDRRVLLSNKPFDEKVKVTEDIRVHKGITSLLLPHQKKKNLNLVQKRKPTTCRNSDKENLQS